MGCVLSAPVSVPKEFDRRNEHAFRQFVEGELAEFYRKGVNVIIPYGNLLGFYGSTGKTVTFGLDGSDNFTISIDDATAITLATSGDLNELSASITLDVEEVENKLVGSFGFALDVNGRIASLKLLSDGTTSEVKFTADVFQIFNGSTDEAPFEVSGGVVKIKTANVGILTAANLSVSQLSAITADLGEITAGSIDLTSGSYVVRHGSGFGVSSDLVLWYGLSSVARASATKTNGVFSLATDGKVYLGTSELGAAGSTWDVVTSHANIFWNPGGSSGASPDTAVTTVTGGTGSISYSWEKLSGDAEMGYSTTGTGGKDLIPNVTGAVFSTVYSAVYRCTITDADGRVALLQVAASAQWS